MIVEENLEKVPRRVILEYNEIIVIILEEVFQK